MSKRRNGECSIFPYRNGYAAYAWVTTPDGERKRKWVYGKTHDEVHAKWIKLQGTAAEGPVPTSVPSVSQYMNYWLREVIKPNLAPKTYEKYETFTRLHILPYLGAKRLDKPVTMEIYTEIPSAATRDALRRLSQWLDSYSSTPLEGPGWRQNR